MPSSPPWLSDPTVEIFDTPGGFTKILVAKYELSMRSIIQSQGDIVQLATMQVLQQIGAAVEQELLVGLKDIIRDAVVKEVKEQVKKEVADRIDELVEALV